MPAHFTVRALLFRKPDGNVETYVPFIEYQKEHQQRSDTWQNEHARAIGLFWDFCVEHAETDLTPRKLFREFAMVLLEGTLDRESTAATKMLAWSPVPIARCRRLIACIEQFSNWYGANCDAGSQTLSEQFRFVPNSGESFSHLLMWGRLRKLSMLQHLKRSPPKPHRSGASFGRPITAGKEQQRAKSFPAEHAERLLWEGYLRPGRETEPNIFYRYNVRDMMMALLDGWGGLRRSEGLHLWCNDIQENEGEPGHALVVLSHPEEGPAQYEDPFSGASVKTLRKTALQSIYGLSPRNVVKRGHYHVGWKGMALNTDYQTCVFWIDKQAAALFLVLYRGYMQFVRPAVMIKRRAMGGSDHPFFFVSEGINDKTGLPGEPYSEKAYERNHAAAVLRIGLRHGKEWGTTTHGLRHRFGQTMYDLNVPPEIIRQGLHHTNILSHLIYTDPLPEHVDAVLRNAQKGDLKGDHLTAPFSETTTIALRKLRDAVRFGELLD